MTQPLPNLLAEVIGRMPAPAGTREVERLEVELASWAQVPYAVAVSSGTAALHTAMLSAGIGMGDEVLVPAASVVMSVIPVYYTGALPVFIDCASDGFELDYDDMATKVTRRTRAILPVHLWGRASCDPDRLLAFAQEHRLTVIEDACQAHGTRDHGRLLGTIGDIGCFSLKDGKVLWSGEGGFLLTRDEDIAVRARAFRTHWQTPPPGEEAFVDLGFNYRLAEPLAAIARWNLSQIRERLATRKSQTMRLTTLIEGTLGLEPIRPRAYEGWNAYSPLFRLTLPNPRQFCRRLAAVGVPNSIGTHRLMAAHLRPLFAPAAPCPNAETVIDSTLAVTLSEHDDDDRIRTLAEIISKEARQWSKARDSSTRPSLRRRSSSSTSRGPLPRAAGPNPLR